MVHFSNNKDEWETPPEIFDPLDAEFHFDLDAAADHRNTKCQLWLGPGGLHEDGLTCDWSTLFTNEHQALHEMQNSKTEHARIIRSKSENVIGDGSGVFKPTVWLNCPYSQLAKWVAKSSLESQHGVIVVMLIPARTDTRAWHTYIYDSNLWKFRPGVEVRFLPGRVRFVGGQHCAPFPSCIVIFRPV